MQLTTSWQTVKEQQTSFAGAKLQLQAKYSSQSTTNNTSTVDARLLMVMGNAAVHCYTDSCNFSGGTFDGSDYKGSYYHGWEANTTTTILSQTKTVTHNADGTKGFNIGAYFTCSAGVSGSVAETYVSLPKINRRSEFSLSKSTFNIGETIKATITQYVSAYHQNLYMVISGSEVLIQNNVTGTVDIETNLLANQIYQAIPNAKYLTGTFKLYTYDSSNNLIGTVTKDYRANVVDSEPTFDIAYQDTNATTLAITSDSQEIIQNNSTLQFNFTNVASRHYSTLSSYSININGEVRTASISTSTLDVNWGVVNLSNDSNVSVSVTDSRGFTTTKTVALSILAWQLPTAQITLNRKQNYYTETDINVDATYSSLDGNNTITIQYRTKKTSDANYGSYANLSDNVTTTFNADNVYSWDVQVLLTDRLGSTTYNLTLGIGLPIFFIDRQKRSLGVNCFPSGNGTIEVNNKDISNTYSTTEMKIGTWTDGKPIYRRVITFTTPATETDYNIDTSSYNVNYMLRMYGGIYISGGSTTQIPHVIWFGSSYYYTSFRGDTNRIIYRGSSNYGSKQATLILEYTKTTD